MTINEIIANSGQSQAPSTGTSMTNLVGVLLSLGSLYAQSKIKDKTYADLTEDARSKMGAVIPDYETKVGGIEKGLAADMAGYSQASQQQAQEGLGVRGITDPGVAREVKQQTAKGLSGAYAAAASALAQAKVNASAKLSGAMSTYNQDLAQRQYNSLLQNYTRRMGLYGALGSLGGSILGIKSSSAPEQKGKDMDYKEYIVDPSQSEEQFKMKGVKFVEPVESTPLMLDPQYRRNK